MLIWNTFRVCLLHNLECTETLENLLVGERVGSYLVGDSFPRREILMVISSRGHIYGPG